MDRWFYACVCIPRTVCIPTLLLCCVSVCPETKVFYRALSQVGTDFTMMTLLVEGRTRGDLKVGGALVWVDVEGGGGVHV